MQKIIPYNPKLKEFARKLRKNSTLSEILLWKKIKGKAFGVEFHRQVPLNKYIVDFYCHELKLAIEIDGNSHNQKLEYDTIRENKLNNFEVNILRFNDLDVKKDMNSVLMAIEITISESNDIPLPPSKGELSKHSDNQLYE